MPPPPLIKSRFGQRLAVALAMGVVLAASVVLAWVLTGASLALPGPGTGVAMSRVHPAFREVSQTIAPEDLPFALPAGWTPAKDRYVEALRGAPQAVFSDPSRPQRWIRFAMLDLNRPLEPDDFINQIAQMLWSETKQEPVRPMLVDKAGGIYGVTLWLAPSVREAGGVGDLDLFAAITPDGRSYWVLHMRDTIGQDAEGPEAAGESEGRTVLKQDIKLFEQFYHQAMTHAASPEGSTTEPNP